MPERQNRQRNTIDPKLVGQRQLFENFLKVFPYDKREQIKSDLGWNKRLTDQIGGYMLSMEMKMDNRNHHLYLSILN